MDYVGTLKRMLQFNLTQGRHRAQIDRLYGEKERKAEGRRKLYALVPIALCQCEICVELAEEVYST